MGGIFEAGDEVISGNYFKATDQTLLNQILIKRNKATFLARSIEYICSELDWCNGTINLTDSLHRRILISI